MALSLGGGREQERREQEEGGRDRGREGGREGGREKMCSFSMLYSQNHG